MSGTDELVRRYLATWNETDPAARRAALAEVFAEDAVYTDPLVSARGRDELDATIAAVQGQFGGLVFTLGGAVDAHHDIARFTWHLGPEGGEPLAIGFDVAVIGADGRIGQMLGFLDKVPAGA
ncbi:nuclear transport factor 2 family protein [Spongiactinospora sp. TRM90649]|uniref:nuclear transport factor 2 family protein n=1 Tax=Spongiactinospora sp. TRM90649 TaxID=3031114 RepID=UPI0023F61F14|nr:nuclear transport factor 2 family protein [Spongiactinospora sp. TRM90649]MDF5754402.1 nuclear transport factor 2 family protein [Spongiactinospora sp. TRM90649]